MSEIWSEDLLGQVIATLPVSILLFGVLCSALFTCVLFVDHRKQIPIAPQRMDDCDAEAPVMHNPASGISPKVWDRIRKARMGLTFLIGITMTCLLVEGVRLVFFLACFAVPCEHIPQLGVVILPGMLLCAPFLLMEIALGVRGRKIDSAQREWMARLRAFASLIGGGWVAVTFFSLLGPWLFKMLAQSAIASYTVWAGWAISTIGGILAGRGKVSNQAHDASSGGESRPNRMANLLAIISPPIFIIGLLILIATFVQWAMQVPGGKDAELAHRFYFLSMVSLALGALFGWRIDINDFSMHAFYRDRLARCYAGAIAPHRKPNLFTGFTRGDRCLRIHQLLPEGYFATDTEGNEIKGKYKGPFPLICTSINLTMGEDLAYQERRAASFAFTPLYSGYSLGWTAARTLKNQYNGFVDTRTYVYAETGSITLATACAISGAAASPNMGYHSNPAVAFLLTVFNVRLGWWLRNPRRRRIATVTPYKLRKQTDPTLFRRIFPLCQGLLPSSPRFGLLKLISELLGLSNDTTSYVYLTDGGHFDNMGLYELLRRRCRNIVVCDAEADPRLEFEGIGMAIRKARLDFGVEVTLDRTDPVQEQTKAHRTSSTALVGEPFKASSGSQITDPAAPTPHDHHQPHGSTPYVFGGQMNPDTSHVTGTISRHDRDTLSEGLTSFAEYPANSIHCVHGTVRYPEDTEPSQYGHILYIKASLTGDEPPDILNYRRQHENFPQDATLSQFSPSHSSKATVALEKTFSSPTRQRSPGSTAI